MFISAVTLSPGKGYTRESDFWCISMEESGFSGVPHSGNPILWCTSPDGILIQQFVSEGISDSVVLLIGESDPVV